MNSVVWNLKVSLSNSHSLGASLNNKHGDPYEIKSRYLHICIKMVQAPVSNISTISI